MNLLIRPPNLEILTPQGIPHDFRDVRDYFNRALLENTLHYIPRRTRITDEEILSLWIPQSNKNTCFVAEDLSKKSVVGCITYFAEPFSTKYEHASQRRRGDIAGTTDQKYTSEETFEINLKMTSSLIKELRRQKKQGFLRIAAESPTRGVLKELNYKGMIIENITHYKAAGLGGIAFEYLLP